MYRYSPNRMRGATGAPKLRERVKTIMLAALIVALVVLAVVGVPAMRFRSEAKELFIARIQLECGNALSLTNSLSRTAGANSAATLGRIRSCVYAMETINSLSVGLSGSAGWIIQEDWFTSLYGMIDSYSSQLLTGMTTSEQQTALYNALQTLSEQLDAAY